MFFRKVKRERPFRIPELRGFPNEIYGFDVLTFASARLDTDGKTMTVSSGFVGCLEFKLHGMSNLGFQKVLRRKSMRISKSLIDEGKISFFGDDSRMRK